MASADEKNLTSVLNFGQTDNQMGGLLENRISCFQTHSIKSELEKQRLNINIVKALFIKRCYAQLNESFEALAI